MFYRQAENRIITNLGRTSIIPNGAEEITEEKYNTIMATIQEKPDDTVDEVYELSAETEAYVARETTHDEKVQWYFNAVSAEEMTLEEVPEDFAEEVGALMPNVFDNPQYAAGYEQALIDLMQENEESEE